jgi:hypothetical protein
MTLETDKAENVKVDAITLRAIRVIALSSGRTQADVIRRAVLMYYEAYLEGCGAALQEERLRRGA